MARQKGPIKGIGVFVCDDKAETSTLVIEPLHLNEGDYTNLLAGTNGVTGTVLVDNLGHPYIELTYVP